MTNLNLQFSLYNHMIFKLYLEGYNCHGVAYADCRVYLRVEKVYLIRQCFDSVCYLDRVDKVKSIALYIDFLACLDSLCIYILILAAKQLVDIVVSLFLKVLAVARLQFALYHIVLHSHMVEEFLLIGNTCCLVLDSLGYCHFQFSLVILDDDFSLWVGKRYSFLDSAAPCNKVGNALIVCLDTVLIFFNGKTVYLGIGVLVRINECCT